MPLGFDLTQTARTAVGACSAISRDVRSRALTATQRHETGQSKLMLSPTYIAIDARRCDYASFGTDVPSPSSRDSSRVVSPRQRDVASFIFSPEAVMQHRHQLVRLFGSCLTAVVLAATYSVTAHAQGTGIIRGTVTSGASGALLRNA